MARSRRGGDDVREVACRRWQIGTSFAARPAGEAADPISKGQIGDQVGLSMELVPGPTLEERLRTNQRFDPREAAAIGVQVCGAVAAVHRAGLLHRDIKATNVVRADDGRVVLMDFGTGRELDDGSTSDLTGTPLYLAPEVFRGESATVRSDIYAVGVLTVFLTERNQRLGDLAAGTVVVHDRPVEKPAVADGSGPATTRYGAARLTPEEIALVETYLGRRHSLDEYFRLQTARQLAARMRDRLGVSAESAGEDEQFLSDIAAEYRARAFR